MLYYDMGDYRQKLIDERKRIEELLKASPKTTHSKISRQGEQRQYFDARYEFRSIFPDVPFTNRRLEQQQDALIRQQEANLRTIGHKMIVGLLVI
nr:hypothetical protein BaRGS_009008 [Batillaria attramentaria]